LDNNILQKEKRMTTALVWFLWIALITLIVLVVIDIIATAVAVKVIRHVETIEDEYRSPTRITYRHPDENHIVNEK